MDPIFVYGIKELENSDLQLHEALAQDWFAHALDGTDIEGDSGEFDATLTLSGRDVVVRGTVRARVRMACARCLNDTTYDLHCELSLLLQPDGSDKLRGGRVLQGLETDGAADVTYGSGAREAKRPRGKGRKAEDNTEKPATKQGKRANKDGDDDDDGWVISSQDAEIDSYSGNQVVLDGFLREAILLEIPIFPLCSEACPGIGGDALLEAASADGEVEIDPRLAPLLNLKAKSDP